MTSPEMADAGAAFSPGIIEGLLNAVLIVDGRGCVLYANGATEQLLGWRVASLVGEPFADLVPERLRPTYRPAFAEFVSADPPRASYVPGRVVMRRADSSEVPFDIGLFSLIRRSAQRLSMAVLWEVTDRVDFDRYQRVSDELVAFLAGASGTTAAIVPELLAIVATSMDFQLATAWRWDAQNGMPPLRPCLVPRR